jgi:hypothetical protein
MKSPELPPTCETVTKRGPIVYLAGVTKLYPHVLVGHRVIIAIIPASGLAGLGLGAHRQWDEVLLRAANPLRLHLPHHFLQGNGWEKSAVS